MQNNKPWQLIPESMAIFAKNNARYDKAKELYEAYSLEEVVERLSHP